jgi:hypothetical protein
MDQQSPQVGDLPTSAFGYVPPAIVCLGSITELTMGIGGAGTDSAENAPIEPGFS